MYTSFLLFNVVIINLFCLQNVLGRYILVKLDQQAVSFPRSQKDVQEKIACLKGEGIPEECLSFFKTTKGYEKCDEKLNENPALELETTLEKCIGVSNTDVSGRDKGCEDCADCANFCLFPPIIGCPLAAICGAICLPINCTE